MNQSYKTTKKEKKNRYIKLNKERKNKRVNLSLSKNKLEVYEEVHDYFCDSDCDIYKSYGLYDHDHNDYDIFIIHRNKKQWDYRCLMISKLNNLKRVIHNKILVSYDYKINEKNIKNGKFTTYCMFYDDCKLNNKIIYTFDDYLCNVLFHKTCEHNHAFMTIDKSHANFVRYNQLLILRSLMRQKMNMDDDAFCDYWSTF